MIARDLSLAQLSGLKSETASVHGYRLATLPLPVLGALPRKLVLMCVDAAITNHHRIDRQSAVGPAGLDGLVVV